MIFFDTETCGFHGPIVLIQWAEDDGPVNMHSVWTEPISETLELIEMLCDHEGGVCAFNLAFDWFHICQTYTTLSMFTDQSVYPEDVVDQYALYEEQARDGLCLKPIKALDLMLHARKTEYQSTMGRKSIKIKRVPTALAWELIKELNERIKLKDVYFAKYKNKKERWVVTDILDDFNDIIPEFKDIVLTFAPSSELKALAQDALGVKEALFFKDIALPKTAQPAEKGFAPYAMAIGQPGKWNDAWPDYGKIRIHIHHWAYNELARQYAEADVKYLQGLYDYFNQPAIDDDDSVLACMVGAVRWKGFQIDQEAIIRLKTIAQDTMIKVRKKFNFNSPAVCRKYLEQVLDETEKLVMCIDGKTTTKAVILQDLAKWTVSEICPICGGLEDECLVCGGDGLIETDEIHPVAIRAQEILDARHAKKEIENYDKLLLANRFHASFNVIGAKSNRMSGADGLNPQGIKKSTIVRECFPLAFAPMVLCGGDLISCQITIADAVYKDPILHKELLSGKKMHGLFGVFLFPPRTYDEILATKGATIFENDLYGRSKNGVFAMLFGGEEYTLMIRVGVSAEAADKASRLWKDKYKVWGREREKVFDMFCSMRQPGGIGTKVEWHEPADYIESMFQYRRYFTLENSICKVLFDLGEKPPQAWSKIKMRVVRRDREQTASGAVRSAVFAAAFALQAANMRAAANHVIQSPEATIIKVLQRRIWDIQPPGINHWRVQPLNIHDEVMCPTIPQYIDTLSQIVSDFIEEYREFIPLLAIDWETNIGSWADK